MFLSFVDLVIFGFVYSGGGVSDRVPGEMPVVSTIPFQIYIR